ncbi:MAG: Fur family transcriptional regulator [Actinomycetota bacterium]
MSTLLERLRGRGWRITPQRRAVAQALVGDHIHLTADQTYERARRIVPELSRATVYNTLRELVEMGEVMEVESGRSPTRFDPNVEGAHQHLICVSCGELLDVHTVGQDALRPDDSHGYSLVGASITFRGYCPSCAVKDGSPVT